MKVELLPWAGAVWRLRCGFCSRLNCPGRSVTPDDITSIRNSPVKISLNVVVLSVFLQCYLIKYEDDFCMRFFLRILLAPLKAFFQTYIYTEQAHILTKLLWWIFISYNKFIFCSVTFICQKQQLFPVLTYRIRQNALTSMCICT